MTPPVLVEPAPLTSKIHSFAQRARFVSTGGVLEQSGSDACAVWFNPVCQRGRRGCRNGIPGSVKGWELEPRSAPT